MIDLYSLVKDTSAYKTIKNEKINDRLSHAYLILTADEKNLKDYLKIFASLLVCKNDDPCGRCRACELIKKEALSDVVFYPKGEVINSEEVNSLIEESYIKPIEEDKKVFVLLWADKMNLQAQNKLLKTLEEPSKNVHILLGATSEYPLLSTIKSRVKKLESPSFSKEKLYSVLKDECDDLERLKTAISCGDGTVGKALALYQDEKLKAITDLAEEVIVDMASSKDLIKYSVKITGLKCELDEFLSVLETLFRDMMISLTGGEELMSNANSKEKLKEAKGYTLGAIVNALEKIAEAKKRAKFNTNTTMLIEWVLFQILEGKYKWQKL